MSLQFVWPVFGFLVAPIPCFKKRKELFCFSVCVCVWVQVSDASRAGVPGSC